MRIGKMIWDLCSAICLATFIVVGSPSLALPNTLQSIRDSNGIGPKDMGNIARLEFAKDDVNTSQDWGKPLGSLSISSDAQLHIACKKCTDPDPPLTEWDKQ